MNILAFLLALFLWLVLLLFLNLKIHLSYGFKNDASDIHVTVQCLFLRYPVKIHLSRGMTREKFREFMDFLFMEKKPEETLPTTDGITKKVNKRAKRRERKVILGKLLEVQQIVREIFRHYFAGWSRFLALKRSLQKRKEAFYRQVKVRELRATVEIGWGEADETALIAGTLWGIFGIANARVLRLFSTENSQIRYQVVPRFDKQVISCQLHCIVNLKLSHIIYTIFQLVRIILNYRRSRPNGRTSNRKSNENSHG